MTPKNYFYVLLGIVVVLLAGGGYGYYWATGEIHSSTRTLSAQLTSRDLADNTIGALIDLQGQYKQQVVPILPLLDQILPHTKNQTEILLQLQTLANQSGLTIKSLSLPAPVGLPSSTSQTTPATAGVLALPITFDVSGSYAQLQGFLTQVENLNRTTNVTSLSVTTSSGKLVYSMTVDAYEKP